MVNRIKGRELIRLLSALISGSFFCITAILFLDLLDMGNQTKGSLIVGAGSLSVSVFLWLVFTGLRQRIKSLPLQSIFIWGIGAVLISSVFVAIISYRIPLPHSLVVTALAEKNDDSKGKEVWLVGRRHSFGNSIDVPDFDFSSGWEMRKNDVVAYKDYKATATWSGRSHVNEQLFFLTHPFSGKVEVNWDGSIRNYDLYSEERGYIKIFLPKVSSGNTWWTFKFFFTLLGALFLWVLSVFIALPSSTPANIDGYV